MILEVKNKLFIKTIDLGHSVVHLRNDGIVQVNFADDVEMDKKESEEVVDAIGKLTDGKKSLVLNIGGVNTTVTAAGRDHSASEDGTKYTLADAFVTNSLPQKILANFYVNFNKPLVPTKIFSETDKAIEWLKNL